MNRWGLMSALALAAALLLMGCRETEKQTDMAEEHPITYEDVCERNTISALLERHEVVTVTCESVDSRNRGLAEKRPISIRLTKREDGRAGGTDGAVMSMARAMFTAWMSAQTMFQTE